MNVYQEVIRNLKELKANGVDIGNAIRYCSDNAFELTALHSTGKHIQYLVNKCLENK